MARVACLQGRDGGDEVVPPNQGIHVTGILELSRALKAINPEAAKELRIYHETRYATPAAPKP